MTQGCVLDASGVLAILAPTQSTPAARAFAADLPKSLLAPGLLGVEVRHALLRLERRGSLPAGEADLALADFERTIELAPAPEPQDLLRALALARQETLGMFDALYIDLALTRGARLASRDAAMLAAAVRRSIATIDLR